MENAANDEPVRPLSATTELLVELAIENRGLLVPAMRILKEIEEKNPAPPDASADFHKERAGEIRRRLSAGLHLVP